MTVLAVPPQKHTDVEIIETDLLTANQARHITDRIRERLGEIKQLVLDAYEGQVHVALGYLSWEAYVDGELSISKTHSYRLLEAARAERALTAIVAEGDAELPSPTGYSITMPERVTRGIDISEAIEQVRGRLNGNAGNAEAVLATFRQVAEEMRARPPEPDESVAESDTRHMTNLDVTQIADPISGGVAWLWESTTGWNRGWCRIVRTGDPRDILAAWSELQSRYRKHLRGETLEGSDLSIARPRASTHDPSDWQGPVERGGVKGWVAPSGHFYPETAAAARKMIGKRRALGLPIS